MIEFAESEAPGTAGYFRFLQQFLGDGSTTGVSASGDCETDIASVQEFIDQADSIGDLTVAQTMEFSGLLGAVSAECSPERLEEFFCPRGCGSLHGGRGLRPIRENNY